jgi:hypothetical protein
MSLPLPKITYDPGSGAVDLLFSWPPVSKPAALERQAVRHDSDTISGIRQSFLERIDQFWTLQMDYVPQEDQTAWAAFLDYALTGGQFTYYPDQTDLGTSTLYTLDDQDWTPDYAFRDFDKFKLRFRKVIA